jgi:hypothetical protein
MNLFARPGIALLAGMASAASALPHQSHASNPNDLVCKDVPMSGSRLDAKRVCMTRMQWEDMQRDARNTTDKAQRQQVNGHM